MKGRPIITAHSWCTVEASKFLQEKLGDILLDFKLFLSINGYQCPVLKDSKELLGALETLQLDNNESYTFVTFDFKDLYTNILYEDAKETLKSLEKLLGLDTHLIDLILDLYKFCNEWNYFNVGGDLFKQVKGVSMGCYFSKEISDLVLLHSEYNFLEAAGSPSLILLRRYADDGLAIFQTHARDTLLVEIKEIMMF